MLASAGRSLLASLGEYVRQTMHGNPEWRDGIVHMEAALRGLPFPDVKTIDDKHDVTGDRCEVGNQCGRLGCPECQQ
jgi:hypothetical protein